jgi:hypothetical protein
MGFSSPLLWARHKSVGRALWRHSLHQGWFYPMSQYRPRKKIYRLIYEGNNKTERAFFQHLFHKSFYMPVDELPSAPKTDPQSLYQFGIDEIKRLGLSRQLGDRVFIVLDLDHR